jgi:hypothetical protein
MSLIFPRAAALAERAWTNPQALSWQDLEANGAPPTWYWEKHLKDALIRLNTVVENFEMQGVGVSRLQPKFCDDHPEYCSNFTNSIMPPIQGKPNDIPLGNLGRETILQPFQRPSQLLV